MLRIDSNYIELFEGVTLQKVGIDHFKVLYEGQLSTIGLCHERLEHLFLGRLGEVPEGAQCLIEVIVGDQLLKLSLVV